MKYDNYTSEKPEKTSNSEKDATKLIAIFAISVIVVILMGAALINALVDEAYGQASTDGVFQMVHFEEVDRLQPIQWGLENKSPGYKIVGHNMFTLKQRYQLQDKELYVLHLRLVAKEGSRIYTGMTRLYLEPEKRNLTLQINRDEFRTVPSSGPIHHKLWDLYFSSDGMSAVFNYSVLPRLEEHTVNRELIKTLRNYE